MNFNDINDVFNFLDDNWFSLTTKYSNKEYKIKPFNNFQIREFHKQKEITINEDEPNLDAKLLKLCRDFLQGKVKSGDQFITIGELSYFDFIEIFLYHKSLSAGNVEIEFNCDNLINNPDNDDEDDKILCNTLIDLTFKYGDLKYTFLDNEEKLKHIFIKGQKNIDFVIYFKDYNVNNVIDFFNNDSDYSFTSLIDYIGILKGEEEQKITFTDEEQKITFVKKLDPESYDTFLNDYAQRPTIYWEKLLKCTNEECKKEHKLVFVETEFANFFV
jgi:hypothetical protein